MSLESIDRRMSKSDQTRRFSSGTILEVKG